jgi:hypothetical protein
MPAVIKEDISLQTARTQHTLKKVKKPEAAAG